MRVRLFANLAETAGERDISVTPPEEATVAEALELVFERHPQLREMVVADDGHPHDHINILVNGTSLGNDGLDLATSVSPDDELAIFPPVSGG